VKDKKKPSSLFDEDDEDDLFSKPKVDTAAEPKTTDTVEEEEDLPPGPESSVADYSNAEVTVSYNALLKLLVSQELIITDYTGSPEELAQWVVEEASHL